jgi:ATP-dependent DNA helicase RecG
MAIKSASRLSKENNSSLNYLFSDVQFLKGVGPKKGEVLNQYSINTVFDLFYYVPRRYIDRTQIVPVGSILEGMTVTLMGTVTAFGLTRGRRNRFVAVLEDGDNYIELVWFSGYRYLEKAFAPGDLVLASGKVSFYQRLYMAHPEFEVVGTKGDTHEPGDETIHTGRLIPVYPENAAFKGIGLNSRGLRRIIKPALDYLNEHPYETIPERWRQEYGLPNLSRAIKQAHFPDTMEAADSGRQRLAFEELFYLELVLAGRHKQRQLKSDGIILQPPMKNGRRLLDSLGFKLTKAQVRVLNEIYKDMGAKHQMNRLIQGDVGSGKTIVAVLAMLGAIESGYQTALMAPTEILAEQHYYSISELLKDIDIPIVLLTSSVKGRKRAQVMESIASGASSIIIGTHALIEQKVKFHKLGMAVIDEQHRFGVVQRASLRAKGKNPDILVMTATPIPRSLAMTLYGDLDVSVINEMPPGRIPIDTKYIEEGQRDEIYAFIRAKVKQGQSAYIVYPLVEKTEKLDLKAATEAYEHMKSEVFPNFRVGLLHGQMKSAEKLSVMLSFKNRELDILVATTIVEVGLDVASATIMVIEHGERFGLSQLHQLRGRVGRAGIQSYCFILTGEKCGEEALKRIEVLTSTNDGFKIAEADLELRGPGEVLGTRQHGLPELRVAKLSDTRLMELSRRLAFQMIEDDPHLLKPENSQMKIILKKRLGNKLRYAKIG